jgi:hypothetical protein
MLNSSCSGTRTRFCAAKVGRVRYQPVDRVWLAALSRLISRVPIIHPRW